MLMFAYGSNLNIKQMTIRCPKAVPLGRLRLPNAQLVFRGVADCIREEGGFCYGAVWRITEECEYALDIYEGVAMRMYRKEYIPIKETPDGERELLIYRMNSTGIFPPSVGYFKVIQQGYRDFCMPRRAYRMLNGALRQAWDDKAPSYRERKRYHRNGRPQLAECRKAGHASDRQKEITLAEVRS